MTKASSTAVRDLGARAAVAAAVVVLLAAAVLRLARLDALPPGVHTDEAHNALDAWAIVGGWRPAFLPGNNGREPLFMYLVAAAMAGLGPSAFALRATGALVGLVAVAACGAAARGLPLDRPRRTAVLTAAYAAATFWPVAQARTAVRGGLLPVWTAVLLLAWWRVLDPGHAGAPRRTGRLAWAAAAGVALGGALLTHLTGRVLPAAVVVSAAAVIVDRRTDPRRRRDVALAAALALVVAAVVASPLLVHLARHPAAFAERLDRVRIVGARPVEDGGAPDGDGPGSPEAGGALGVAATLADSAVRIAAAPVVRGDRLWYHNAKQRPIWPDAASRIALAAGVTALALALARRASARRRVAAGWAALLLATTLAPSWLSLGAPNFFRMTGAWPVLFLVPALGLDAAMAAVERGRGRTGRAAAAALGALALAVLAATTGRDYLLDYARRPEVAAAFDADAGARGRQLARLLDEGPVWVSPLVARQSILRLHALPRALDAFDPAAGIVLPAHGDGRYVLDPLEVGEARRLLRTWPALQREPAPALAIVPPGPAGGERTAGPAPAALQVLRLTHDAARTLGGPPVDGAPRFGDALRLARAGISHAVVAPGGTITVTVALDVLAPAPPELSLFVHALAGERAVAQLDGPPLGAGAPTDRWRPGTRVLLARGLAVAADAPAGPVEVRVGLYDWRDGSRLPVEGDDDGALRIGSFEVGVANAAPR